MPNQSPLFRTPESGFRSVAAVFLWLSLVLWDGRALAIESQRHPLDPLSAQEISAVSQLLNDGGYGDLVNLYPLITLHEPAKAKVLRWKPGKKLPRRAFVIAMGRSRTYEAVVDLTLGKVTSWKPVAGVQPNVLLSEEWRVARKIVMGNKDWQAAMRKRGYHSVRDIVCIPHTVGYFGDAGEQGRRLLKVTCYDSRGISNFWGRPIGGLIAVVDADAAEVVRVIDTGIVPVPQAPVDFAGQAAEKPLNPIKIVQTSGPGFEVHGQVVTWQNWQFHYRIDPRLGPVISLVRYNDHGKMRSVLYQGSLSELFVPYMDPGQEWYFKTYLDAGEYGVGKLATELQPGSDCPGNARYFDAVFADDWGLDYRREQAVCLFERYAGDVAWRHFEAVNGQTEVRRRTDLVLRFITAIGNYDYIFDWVFRQNGTIEINVGSTGTEQVKAVNSRSQADDKDGRDTAFGHRVAEHTVAINHDHYFCFRLDMDVDGGRNSFLIDRLQSRQLGPQSPRKSIWVIEPEIIKSEQDAKLRINLETPALWRVINPRVSGPLDYPVSYQLKPKTNAVSLLLPDDHPQQRAGFTDHHLWVTPYEPGERYAAGIYPNQSKGGDGLPRWTRANRPLQDKDIVLWYTLGFHHVVRAEDWPILSTAWHGFELRPFDFFARNPALGVRNQPNR